MTDPVFIVFVLGTNIVIAELLARRSVGRHLGTTLIVMLITAAVANLGVIPTSIEDAPVYDGILDYVTPLAIFWLLLRVNLRDALNVGFPMIGLFLAGSIGTAVGVVMATWLLDGRETIGESYRVIGGLFVGTYTGGSVNFNALALHYGINKQAGIFGGITAVDNILTTFWMAATIAIPKLLGSVWPKARYGTPDNTIECNEELPERDHDIESVRPIDLAALFAIGTGSLWASRQMSSWLEASFDITLPSIVILTTIALSLAQTRFIQRRCGSQVLGLFAMYVFLATIAALCDLAALREMGRLGIVLLAFASLVIAIHAFTVFATAAVFRIDVGLAAIASQANIGGATTAVGVARSLRRRDLVLPAVLVGSLGYAVGTYLGFIVVEIIL